MFTHINVENKMERFGPETATNKKMKLAFIFNALNFVTSDESDKALLRLSFHSVSDISSSWYFWFVVTISIAVCMICCKVSPLLCSCFFIFEASSWYTIKLHYQFSKIPKVQHSSSMPISKQTLFLLTAYHYFCLKWSGPISQVNK